MATIKKRSLSRMGWDLVNDLSALPENEDVIVEYLLDRLQRGEIYTWVGSLLLALNPCDETPTMDTYSSTVLEKYIDISDITYKDVAPHIFAVASKAHYSLTQRFGRNCQVIVISGETGTGKTFNACKCLEFLSILNERPTMLGQGDAVCNIMQRITDACRLISAFTTACTERNEVSSRHGQLVQLYYNGGTISGATINSFLLERSRVTKGSSNFQIFYQMMFGMADNELEALYLSRNREYDILSTVEATKRETFREGFRDTSKAFEVLGIGADQKRGVFQILALLVHLGDVRFVEDGEVCTIDLSDRKSKESLRHVCAISCLSEAEITELLTTILINPQSTWRKHTAYHRNLLSVNACQNRLCSIIRHIYDLLFHWVLNHANDALSVKRQCIEWLGILDIFGFESFNANGMEQLSVNYANEKMQQYFMETYLENNRRDLLEEGFIDNKRPLDAINVYKARLSVLEGALFLTLNDASQSPVAIGTSTIIQLACGNVHNIHRRFLSEKHGNFIIEHYSGPVAYSIKDLLHKNADKVPTEISATFSSSQNKFLRSLFSIGEQTRFHAIRTSSKKRTMLAKLKYSMDTLIKELRKCDLYYVRCVKPSRSQARDWDRKDFRKQLACTGIFDALPLTKCKYPVRLSYKDFQERYSRKGGENDNLYKRCRMILESIAAKKEIESSVYCGKRLIFLTGGMFHKLELCRRNYLTKCANKIQSFWLTYRQRKIRSASKHVKSLYTANEVSEKIEEIRESCDFEEGDDGFISEHYIAEVSASTIELNSSSDLECSKSCRDDAKDLSVTESSDVEVDVSRISTLSQNSAEVVENSEHNFANLRKKFTDIDSHRKNEFRDLYILGGSENITGHSNNKNTEICMSNQEKNLDNYGNSIDINCNTILASHNQSDNNYLNRSEIDAQIRRRNKQRYNLHYDQKENCYTVVMDKFTLFYKNRILSRRRPTMVPIRIHTRATCLSNSHVLPRSELPGGLQDCL